MELQTFVQLGVSTLKLSTRKSASPLNSIPALQCNIATAKWVSAPADRHEQETRPMAAMAAENADGPKGPQQRLGVPSRNPLPLSASQEAQVRDIFYARVRSQCSDEIKAFAACALGRTFTVSFACRDPHRAMNNCMKTHATPAEHDVAREEWFAMRLERQKEREQSAKVAAAQEEFMREWWGLPEHVRLSRRKEMEERGERIGGMPARDRRAGGERS